MARKPHKKKDRRRSKRSRHTTLSRHVKTGTALSNPLLGSAPLTLTHWERDLLPEHLWVAALADRFGLEVAHGPFYRFMDAVDEVVPPRPPSTLGTPDRPRSRVEAVGLLSDFRMVPEDVRVDFVASNERLIDELFYQPVGRILAFYPDNPAAWLVPSYLIERDGSLDPEVELGRLRRLVVELLPGKERFGARVRALPFGRVLKHGTITWNSESKELMQVVDAMQRYPADCSEEECWRVEAQARMMINQVYEWGEHYGDRAWPRYFWNHNYDLAPCRPRSFSVVGSTPVSEEDVPQLPTVLVENAENVRAYLAQLPHRVRLDLYDPERDEILMGLFSRTARLYCLTCEDYNLWSRDLGGIVLRCLADTAITFAYLAKRGTPELFRRFREYGEGQEKLLMLHLQDNHPDGTSIEGRSADEIAEELGGFTAELMQIELGSWTKKDARKLAADVGMERYYRLVFSPSSSDVHGTWISLKQSNLLHCVEPLHRLHRLPSFVEPPAYLNVLILAQEIFEFCIDLAAADLGYPELEKGLAEIPVPPQADAGEVGEAEPELPRPRG